MGVLLYYARLCAWTYQVPDMQKLDLKKNVNFIRKSEKIVYHGTGNVLYIPGNGIMSYR